MKQVIHYSENEARDFFERLATYSTEYLRVALPKVHRHWPSDNHYDEWKKGHPIGHTLHYTAGVSFAGTVRHFVMGSRASTNWIVAKALDRRFDALRKDLELDRVLRAEVSQVVHPDYPAWHAGWVNRFLASTEIRNAGVLRPYPKAKGEPGQKGMTRDAFFACPDYDVDDLNFYWWASGWTAKFEGEVLRIETPRGISWWESFSRGSIATAIEVLRYLNALYPRCLEPVWMTAHHMLNPGKNDVVLPVDLDKFREAVLFSKEHVDDLDWLAAYDDTEDGFEDLDDPWMLRELDERQADRAEEDVDEDFDPERVPWRRISGVVDELGEGIEALRRFGFCVAGDDAARQSARMYQKGRKLETDGIVGPETLAALGRDLRQWRLR
jgi:hypothetical protein